jgi:Rieske Fe-S protein
MTDRPQDAAAVARSGPGRREVLGTCAAACLGVALGGCATYGGSKSSGKSEAPAAGTAAGTALAKVSEIPVGGGKIFTDKKVVVTQPQKGTIKAFSSTCTHMGCTVTAVRGGTIDCPCHGSRFRISDGAVAGGPAPSPLPPVAVTVKGDTITLA